MNLGNFRVKSAVKFKFNFWPVTVN